MVDGWHGRTQEKPNGTAMRSFARGFVTLSIVVTVTLALFVGAILRSTLHTNCIRHAGRGPIFLEEIRRCGTENHPGKDMAEIRALLGGTWSRGMVYDPVVQFKEAPRTGQYINVHPAGFRTGKSSILAAAKG